MNDAQHNTHDEHSAGEASRARFIRSYAKINVTLDVVGKRSDGYHELATVMQTVDLYDTICISPNGSDEVSIVCSRPELSTADNLAVRAAQVIRKRLGLARGWGVHIELIKRIPVAAGLGGGSSNAAAVLLALQRFWQLPLEDTELLSMAAELGSDVPFFLTGGLALCEGRGEKITPLAPHWPFSMRWLLLVKPTISLSTATVFRNLTASDYSNGTWSRTAQAALQTKGRLLPTDLYNSLERGVVAAHAEVAQAQAALLAAGAEYVRLSGSGPTLFTTFSTLAAAMAAQQQMQAQGYEVYVTQAINPDGNDIQFF